MEPEANDPALRDAVSDARVKRVVGRRWVAGVVTLGLLLTGCGLSCSTVGCSSGAAVLLTVPLQPGPKSTVTVCIDGHCATRSPATSPISYADAEAPFQNERTVTVSILMTGPDGTVLGNSTVKSRLHRNQPNGPGCAPVCYSTRLKLTASGQL